MKPQTIGRVLGIGIRVAGRMAGQRLAVADSPSVPQSGPPARDPRAQGRVAGRASGSLARALGGFFRPFRRAGSIVWLEVTGVFFFLPVLVFAPTLWRTRLSYAHGPEHRTFVASAVVVVVFLYLGVTSFYRARKR